MASLLRHLGSSASVFRKPTPLVPLDRAQALVESALARWHRKDADAARAALQSTLNEFPDDHPPDRFWHEANTDFRGFFTWGHDHDFGHGVRRAGAMSTRHQEIVAECIHMGLLPNALTGQRVLDVGCWSGGDLLILAGLGAEVVALEEHARSAASARHLTGLVGCSTQISTESVYRDRRDWSQAFDLIYCSGVIYHVTDPVLFARILFAYLKPGGRLVLETKASAATDSVCGYSGTLDRGWNWYAPSREALGRWLVDVGFAPEDVQLHRRSNGRLLAGAVKAAARALPETAGFSRPGSWLEAEV
jgi:2-polyprenyl-3-methyl-5-hydroxy-6-metoxy-1,4-benzoquinol methylase